jgi:hypothetical protein
VDDPGQIEIVEQTRREMFEAPVTIDSLLDACQFVLEDQGEPRSSYVPPSALSSSF